MEPRRNDRFLLMSASSWIKSAVVFGAALFVITASAPPAHALTLGQIDTFQDGTTDGWTTGHGGPTNIANGGPSGLGDHYLQTTSSGGSGTDAKLIIFNTSQWLGNYSGAGVTDIGMDLANFGTQPLSMRLAFFTSRGVGYAATTPFSLPADSNWHQAFFPLIASDFTAVGSPSISFNDLLTNFVGQLRILDSASPAVEGDPIAATLGVDDIMAVPEPSVFAMVVGALLTAGWCGRRTRSRPISN
jgi:hypothetical protein